MMQTPVKIFLDAGEVWVFPRSDTVAISIFRVKNSHFRGGWNFVPGELCAIIHHNHEKAGPAAGTGSRCYGNFIGSYIWSGGMGLGPKLDDVVVTVSPQRIRMKQEDI